MAMLCQLEKGDWIKFVAIKRGLELTDGNLGAQLTKLEEASYLRIKKSFEERRPQTQVQATSRGRSAYHAHCKALRQIIDNNPED